MFAGEVPSGHTTDVSCGNRQCIERTHVTVRPCQPPQNKWRALAERIAALSIDEGFDLPDYPTDNANTTKLRSAIGMLKCSRGVRFIVRSYKASKGVRITRTGTWGSIFLGREYENTSKKFPTPRLYTLRPWQRPTAIFLGQLWGSAMHSDDVPVRTRCAERSCPYHATASGYCRHHANDLKLGVSMHDTVLDHNDLYQPWNPYAPYTLAAEFPQSLDSLEKSLRFVRNGYIHDAHKNAGDEDAEQYIVKLHAQPRKRYQREQIELDEPEEINFIPSDEREGKDVYQKYGFDSYEAEITL